MRTRRAASTFGGAGLFAAVAAAGLAVGGTVVALVWSLCGETYDEFCARFADDPYRDYPRLVWATPSDMDFRVSLTAGGARLPGAWGLERLRALAGSPVPDGPAWRWFATGDHTTVDDVSWLRYARVPVPRDLQSLGQAAVLEGTWNWWTSPGHAELDLRPAGVVRDAAGARWGRWAGDDELVVLCREAAWGELEIHAFARNHDLEALPDWDLGRAYSELEDDEHCCEPELLTR